MSLNFVFLNGSLCAFHLYFKSHIFRLCFKGSQGPLKSLWCHCYLQHPSSQRQNDQKQGNMSAQTKQQKCFKDMVATLNEKSLKDI